ncbi:Glycosyltransferase involved in cell wall bisynthesis [Flavobacteriaceae bacterium MAR_2010_188]|nr:Glycosyltransferase involved in cell wall bisynthesis [Flavobacteriaceae bacterium MAR_2010_188]
MAKRKRVGLILLENKEWIAGIYLMLNIIKALDTVDKKLKPTIVIIAESKERFEIFKEETKYPYLEFYQYPEKIIKKYPNTLYGKVSKKLSRSKKELKVDFIYPRPLNNLAINSPEVHWIPDFQEVYLPQFFSEVELKERKVYQQKVADEASLIVFSSRDSYNDFQRLYPKAKSRTFILPFAVIHPDITVMKIDELRKKYGLPKRYFLLPNQFWAHKNHITVLRAAKLLKEKNKDFMIAMTGSKDDYRNKDVFGDLHRYIEENNLENNIKSLGFIPRLEQLCLFKNAIAIIQPSLFEGWSTVVEDAKALKKFLVLSDIDVHREQIKENAIFFDPLDEVDLKSKLSLFLVNDPNIVEIDYQNNIRGFGERIVELIDLLTESKQ